MACKIFKRYVCDLCGRDSYLAEVGNCPDPWIPRGWARFSYDLDDHNGSRISSGEFDICDCCLRKEDSRIMFYHAKMIKEDNHAAY